MKIPRRKRQVTTITLDPEVLKKAKEHNLNISRLSEEALREMIKRIEREGETLGAPEIKKGGERVGVRTWGAIASVIVLVAVIGAWALWPTAPTGTATVSAVAASGTVFAAGIPPGTASGIENVYIMKSGLYTKTENLSGHENILGVITASGGSVDIPYDTPFDIVIAVKAGTDNMAYAVLENMEVELTVDGSFSLGPENCTDKNLFENSGYGTSDGWIRVNAVWDNNGSGYTLPAGGSISLDPIKLWCWG